MPTTDPTPVTPDMLDLLAFRQLSALVMQDRRAAGDIDGMAFARQFAAMWEAMAAKAVADAGK